jgi:hypothetical protein
MGNVVHIYVMEQTVNSMMTTVPGKFKSLFWDTDISRIDIRKHKTYVIERILEYGDTDPVRWMSEFCLLGEILDVLNSSRALSQKSANFWRLVLGQSSPVGEIE